MECCWKFGSRTDETGTRTRAWACGLVGFSCLVRRNRRRWMRPFARMPWHRGGWYVPRGWIWPKRGSVSGIAGDCVCWRRALAPNGEHGIPMAENTNQMAAALIEMQRNCAEGGLYVCREKGAILMQTL